MIERTLGEGADTAPRRTLRRDLIALSVEDAILAAVTLGRAAHRLRASSLKEPLEQAAAALAAALPSTVPQASAARALGVSAKTVHRWVERGRVPLVATRSGALPGIPTASLLELVARVEAVRARPAGGRAVARSLRGRELQ